MNNTTDDYHYDYLSSVETVPLAELIPVATLYSLMLMCGMLGNVLVIFSILRYRCMRNITNTFLLSLASADLLLVVICIPVKLAAFFSFTWTFGEFLCKSVHYLQNVSAICSVFTLTAMSLERYYAIMFPMRAKYTCTVGKACRVIAVLWLLSGLLAVPIVFQRIHKEVGVYRKGYWCVKDWDQTLYSSLYELFMLGIMLVFPVAIMTFAYVSICLELWIMTTRRSAMRSGLVLATGTFRSPPSTESSPYHVTSEKTPVMKKQKFSTDDDATRKQVIKMLVAVILIFVVCWAPILISNVLTAFRVIHHLNYGYLKPMRQTFYLLAYANSVMNPFIYGFMSKHFRDTFYQSLCMCVKGREFQRRSRFLRQNSQMTRSSHAAYCAQDSVQMSSLESPYGACRPEFV
ncbi:QRFP-like peptide receptor [Haliotis rubra]|uniref:QRFP-like peptide receptor n=1 Tax=Haliotis rubra TaxID=36100 RepID=UPI001EE4F0A3|nr:QRFP-like peptide receptor [Haliotis rubra]XP_046543504.1 QRFP-like peptide receptor [Haliotis rubra]